MMVRRALARAPRPTRAAGGYTVTQGTPSAEPRRLNHRRCKNMHVRGEQTLPVEPSVARNSKPSSKLWASTLAVNSSADALPAMATLSLLGARCRRGTLAVVGVRSCNRAMSPVSSEVRCCTAHAHVACEKAATQLTQVEAAAHLSVVGCNRSTERARITDKHTRAVTPGEQTPSDTQGFPAITKHQAKSQQHFGHNTDRRHFATRPQVLCDTPQTTLQGPLNEKSNYKMKLKTLEKMGLAAKLSLIETKIRWLPLTCFVQLGQQRLRAERESAGMLLPGICMYWQARLGAAISVGCGVAPRR
jgi:hypothetical protein